MVRVADTVVPPIKRHILKRSDLISVQVDQPRVFPHPFLKYLRNGHDIIEFCALAAQ